jgi:large subunit ribosomal protein L30e
MAKVTNVVTDIKKLLDADKLVIGGERTMKLLKTGKAKHIYLSKNCNNVVCDDVKRYATLSGIEVTSLDIASDELGAMCRKPFGISVLSVARE